MLYIRRWKWQQYLFIKNIKSFIRNVKTIVHMREVRRERKWETEDCYHWHHICTDIFRYLLLSWGGGWYRTGSQSGGHLPPTPSWRVYSLVALRMNDRLTLWAWKTSSLYIFWTPTHFPSRSIHVIHFQCPWFTQDLLLFWNPCLTIQTLKNARSRRYPAKNFDKLRLRRWARSSGKYTSPSRISDALSRANSRMHWLLY